MTILGQNAAIKQPGRTEVVSGVGTTDDQLWIGPTAKILEKFDVEISAEPTGDWDRIVLQREGPASRLELTAEPTNAALADGVTAIRWELDRNVARKPLRSHPYFALQPERDNYDMDRMEELIRKNKIPDFTEGNPYWFSAVGPTDWSKDYYFHRRSGVQGYNYSSYVLRQIRVCKPSAVVQADHANENTVVVIPEDVPEGLIGSIPAGVEWLKQPPDVSYEGGKPRTFEIIQEYWGGTPKWSIIYGGTWDPSF